ncbi:small integral membrane protein 34A [Mus pahari]|uniref:small integral membrane protein 34A n=1 Tax=Mus pahari TaxID=10093 RepID=UPI000A310E2B|nr:small integral membrane protein 34A [Mus pahari]
MESIKWIPQEAFNQTQPSSLRDPVEGKNNTSSARTLRLSDATSAAWYILTIIGIYGLIFIFRLASNILRKSERSLEDVYYSNLTSELKRKGFRSKVAHCPSLIISNAAALQPQQLGLESKCEDGRLHVGAQVVP